MYCMGRVGWTADWVTVSRQCDPGLGQKQRTERAAGSQAEATAGLRNAMVRFGVEFTQKFDSVLVWVRFMARIMENLSL